MWIFISIYLVYRFKTGIDRRERGIGESEGEGNEREGKG